MLLAVSPALGDHRLDLGVLPRMKTFEGKVLELPLDGVDAEAVCDRRIDLERLLRLLDLLLAAEVLDRPHVVQPVRKLDQDHPRVLGHRHDHLPVVLDLRLLTARKLNPRQLRDALYESGDVLTELGLDVRELCLRVLDHVVEQRGRERLLVEVERGEDLRGAPRVMDEVVARAAHLSPVGTLCERERPAEQVTVDVGLVRLDVRDQLLDEVLMLTLGL